ncbi:hypothetical protein DEH84_04820 [Aquabacterium olei]|uniref:Dystroglycan-type cadherin-like domain-containing protein n=1 Tax=Aquabacterium olei TaxID=1296669 RepID=A0A2U8FR89_9BURK|nr:Ig-like domain-containing protein [Aquabacterium olei]AWI52816.1 hypothetical protein DEH84_04820 [Aquabacterium olei]
MTQRHVPKNVPHASLSTATSAPTSRLVRRAPQPLVLEQRFMFDGAAVGEAVDTLSAPMPEARVTHDVLHVVDAPATPSVRSAELAAEQLLSHFLQQDQAQDTLFALFHGGQSEASADWQARASTLLQDVRSGEFSLHVEFLSNATLKGAKGAFAADGPQGEAVIYLNQDWVQAGADEAAITRVLTEEFGHAVDAYLNGAQDTAGDEGEAFAVMLANGSLSLQPVPSLEDGGTIEVMGEHVNVEFAQFTFVNAYQMVYDVDNDFGSNGIIESNAGETVAEKEQNSHNFNPDSLGQVTVSDDTNSNLFSGNDVAAIGLNIGGSKYYGWISRPIKDQGVVRGFYFWTDKDFVDLATAQADGNQDGDSDAKDNRGFLLVVDQAWFNGFINTASNRVTTAANVDQALYAAYGYTYPASPIHTYIKGLGSSSDRVDAALNAEVLKVAAPPPTDAVDDVATGTPSTTNGGGAALEQGLNTNPDPDTVVTPGISATGNVLSNDSPATDLTVTRVASNATGLAGSVPSTGTVSVVGRYGTLTLGANGTYSYAADDANPTVNALLPGGKLTDVFSYTVSNGLGGTDTATLSVQINGSNDAPVAVNDYNSAKESTTSAVSGFTSTGYTASGTVLGKTGVLANDTDVDTGDSKSIVGLSVNGGATGGTVSVVTGTGSLSFTGDSGFTSVSDKGTAKLYVRLATDAAGSNYRAVYAADGTTQIYVTQKVESPANSNNWVITLNATPAKYYDATGLKTITQLSTFFTDNKTVGFENSTAASENTSGMKTASVAIAQTTGYTSIGNLSSLSGSIAVGMIVSGPGVPTDGVTKVSALTYTSGVLTGIKLDRELTSTTGGAFTFATTGTVSQTIQGAHGSLLLNGDGSYTYTATTDNAYLAGGQSAVEVFNYTMQDAGGLTSSAKLYITVYGSGSTDPVLTNESNTATESGVVSNSPYVPGYTNTSQPGGTATGNVLSNDKESSANTLIGSGYVAYVSLPGSSDPATLVDTASNGRTTSQTVTVNGLYGDLQISDTGAYTYTIRQGQTNVQALLPGETLTETFNYQVKNTLSPAGSGWARLVITVNGTNDAPIAVADVATAMTGQSPATGNVLANDTDVDANDGKTVISATAGSALNAGTSNTTITATGVVAGTYGNLTLNADGSYSYAVDTGLNSVKALASGETRDDVFTYQMKDTWGAFSTATLTVTVTGRNDAPENTTPTAVTATAGTPFVFTGANAISVADPDGNLSKVVLHVDHGTLSTTASGGSFVFDGSTGNATLTGTQGEINALLAGLRYTATTGFSGTDYLTIFSKDSQSAYDSDGFAINVPTNTIASVSEAGLSGGSNASADSEVYNGTLTLGLNQTVKAQTGTTSLGAWSIDADGAFTYTLTRSAQHVLGAASDQVAYVAHDTYGNAVTNTVTVNIADDAPTAYANTAEVGQSSSVAGNVLLDGSDDVWGADGAKATSPAGGVVGVRAAGADTTSEVITGVGSQIQGLHGKLTLKADGTYTYTSGSVSGLSTDTFVYTIEDADGSRATATLAITITTADLPPTIAVSSDKTALKAGETATVTFTLSEAATDFNVDDLIVTGGTLSDFNGSGTSYTATFTPGANSTIAASIHVDSAKFTDAAGNANDDGSDSNNTASMTVDTVRPTVVVTSDQTALKAGETATVTFTFSEDPGSSFTSADIDVTGGTLSNFSGSGTSYTATFTPDANSTIAASIHVDSAKFTDAAGNANNDGSDANNTASMSVDTVRPTIVVSSDQTALKAGETATVTFTFSEDPGTSFVLGDIDVTGGTLGALSTKVANSNGTYRYTATFTPAVGSTTAASIHVDSTKFTDAVGNANDDGSDSNNTASMTVDTVRPTVVVTSDKATLKAGETATVTFTFSEDPGSSFTSADIAVTGGTLSNFSGSGTTYTATFTPDANSTIAASIHVDSAKFTDAAGNANNDGSDTNNTASMSVDTVWPTVVVTSDKTALKAGEAATVTFTFSEDPGSSFVLGDIDVTGGTLGTLSTKVANSNGTYSYTATFTPAVGSTTAAAIHVDSAKFTDAAGNANDDGSDANNTASMTVDTVRPTIVVSSDQTTLKAGETATVTFTFSEDPGSSFTSADIAVTGGTLSNFSGSGTSYTATFTPDANSTTAASIHVDSAKFTDAAGNANDDGSDANNTASMTVDTVRPTIVVSSDQTTLKAGETATVTFTFSEDPGSSFTSADIAVTGGTLSNFSGSGTSYTATFTPDANSTTAASIHVDSAKFTDAAGNANDDGSDANNTASMTVDTVRPTIVVSSDQTTLKAGETATVTFTFSEDPGSSFTSADIAVTGGTLSNFSGSGTTYTATFTPDANSTIAASIHVDSAKFTDAAGNANNDGSDTNNTASMSVDTVWPTVVVTSDKTALKAGEAATVTFTFSEDPGSSFVLGDIDVTGGTLGTLSTKVANSNGTYSYTATFTPAVGSTTAAAIHVDNAKFTDAAGNANNDGSDTNNTASMSVDTVRPTVVVTSDKTALKAGETATVTFTFSEDPGTSFVLGDIDVTGGTLGALSAKVANSNGTYSYTATFTPAPTGAARIHVASNRFTDPAGNANQDGSDTDNAIDLSITDDRPLAVSSPTVSESSPYVVFTVNGAPGQRVTLDLQSGSGTTGVDTSGPLQYFDGNEWKAYTPGTPIPLPTDGSPLLVRIALVNDTLFEGAETLRLVASNESGTPYDGQTTITDDGSNGTRFEDSITGIPSMGPADDDRPQPPIVAPTPPAAPTVQPPLRVDAPPAEPVRLAPAPTPLSADPLVLERPASAPIADRLTSPSGFRVAVTPAPTDNLVVFRGVTDQFVENNAPTRISMPYDAFAHSKPDVSIQLAAQQADGRKLPDWVQFDARTGTFVVSAPAGFKGVLQIKVIARDTEGREVSTMFRMHVGEERDVKPQSRNGLSEQLRLAAQRSPGGVERGQATPSRLAQGVASARLIRPGA